MIILNPFIILAATIPGIGARVGKSPSHQEIDADLDMPQFHNRSLSTLDDFDWTVDEPIEFYTKTGHHEAGVGLGHFDRGLDPDGWEFMNPSYGWNFLYHSFGTENGGTLNPTYPYYCLYNYATGIIRLYYFVLEETENPSYHTVSIQYATSSTANTAFSFTSEESAVENDDSKQHRETVILECEKNNWCFADLPTSYDPHPPGWNSFIHIKIRSVTEGELSALGILDIQGELGGYSISYPSVLDKLVGGVQSAWKFGKTADSTVNDITEHLTENRDAWYATDDIKAIFGVDRMLLGKETLLEPSWNRSLVVLGDSTDSTNVQRELVEPTTVIIAAAAVVGFVKGIIDASSPTVTRPTPIKLSGSLNLQGTLTFRSPLDTFEFLAPGLTLSSPENAGFLPSYNSPLGVVGLSSTPVFSFVNMWESCGRGLGQDYYRLDNDIVVLVNPVVASAADVKVALVFDWKLPYGSPDHWRSVSDFNSIFEDPFHLPLPNPRPEKQPMLAVKVEVPSPKQGDPNIVTIRTFGIEFDHPDLYPLCPGPCPYGHTCQQNFFITNPSVSCPCNSCSSHLCTRPGSVINPLRSIGSFLLPGDILMAGAGITYYGYEFGLSPEAGDLTLFEHMDMTITERVVWTAGRKGTMLSFDHDSILRLYDEYDKVVWSAGGCRDKYGGTEESWCTSQYERQLDKDDQPKSYVQMHPSGVVKLVDNGQVLWTVDVNGNVFDACKSSQ